MIPFIDLRAQYREIQEEVEAGEYLIRQGQEADQLHFIERGTAAGLPKAYEWVAALGLVVTLVWLYLELLRLLSYLGN